MLFGFEDSLKELKRELKNAGADMNFVKDWQKSYDKVKKQYPQIESQYTQAKKQLETVHSVLEGMEQQLISGKADLNHTNMRQQISGYLKELKKYQNAFNHEFLIGKDDVEFHSTYASILSLSEKELKEQKDVLILQSEVENLLALVKEALEKEWPSFKSMAYYYIERTDREIFDLPHQDKVEKVERIYENEFLKPMRQVLTESFGEKKANYILEVDVWI